MWLARIFAIFGLFAASAALAAQKPGPVEPPYEANDTLLVLGAVPQEVPPYIDAMEDARKETIWGVETWHGTIAGRDVVVAITGVGKVKASTVATLLITQLKPRLVLMSGTGSRPNPLMRTGDVIVATELYEHDAGSLTRNDMVYPEDLAPLVPSPALLAAAEKAMESYDPPVLTVDGTTYKTIVRKGVVVSSDLFGVPQARIDTLRSKFHADIMEMESAAFHLTCDMLGVPCITVRAGSNVSQEEPSDDYKRLGPIAAKQAGDFGVHLIGYL